MLLTLNGMSTSFTMAKLSTINSLTLSPALAGVMLNPRPAGSRFILFRWFNTGFERLVNMYGALVTWFSKAWLPVMVAFGVLLAWTFYVTTERPTGFVPEEDQGWFFTLIALPPGASLARTEVLVAQAAAIIMAALIEGVALFGLVITILYKLLA